MLQGAYTFSCDSPALPQSARGARQSSTCTRAQRKNVTRQLHQCSSPARPLQSMRRARLARAGSQPERPCRRIAGCAMTESIYLVSVLMIAIVLPLKRVAV
uniref:Uncharacterized protein n=1 Tax=Prymnesium polylepis TaxID=72548 RepID=A0A7S4MHB0_9EUKA